MKTKRPENATVYPLSSAQGLVKMERTYTFNQETTQIPMILTCDRILDRELMTKAIEEEIRRNDSLRHFFFKENKQLLQYFADSFEYTPHFVDMTEKTEAEVDAFIQKTAMKVLKIEKKQLFEIYIIYRPGNRTSFYLITSHFILDTAGILTTMFDTLGVYEALRNGTEMPKPLTKAEDMLVETLKYPETDAFKKDEEFFQEYIQNGGEPVYNSFDGPGRLEQARKKSKNPEQRFVKGNFLFGTATKLEIKTLTAEETKEITDFCMEKRISPQMLFLLGERIWCSRMNHGEPSHLLYLLVDNRNSVASKRCGGDLASSLICRTMVEPDSTFEAALANLCGNQQQLYRHFRYSTAFSLDAMTKLYHIPPTYGYESHMITYFPAVKPDFLKEWKLSFESVSVGHFALRLYNFIYNDLESGEFIIRSEYQKDYYSAEQIRTFNDKTIEAIRMGIRNPSMTMQEFYDRL